MAGVRLDVTRCAGWHLQLFGASLKDRPVSNTEEKKVTNPVIAYLMSSESSMKPWELSFLFSYPIPVRMRK